MKTIYFAGGCFWGTEHLFSLVPGVVKSIAGYANSLIPNPTYEQVCSGVTDAAETVMVVYDPFHVNLEQLIDLYLKSVDPTSINRQGNDVGIQYRTGIYYTDAADASVVYRKMKELDEKLGGNLQIQYGPLINFYPAEERHQKYLEKNPNGYCHLNPELFKMAKAL